ncbi:Putative Autophagy-related protein 3 [Rhizopus microsporus]|nr:Putative Autophagy-related protein 3 [Rhizopus microsporus]
MSVQDAYNKVFSNFQKMRDYLAPVLKNSKFKETGCITPEEFVAAGDFLVYKCPTWSWEGGLEEKTKDYLPADKQFLVTRNGKYIKWHIYLIFIVYSSMSSSCSPDGIHRGRLRDTSSR